MQEASEPKAEATLPALKAPTGNDADYADTMRHHFLRSRSAPDYWMRTGPNCYRNAKDAQFMGGTKRAALAKQ